MNHPQLHRWTQMQLCQVLVKAGYKPHSQVSVMGEKLELISYPFPLDRGEGVGCMVRQPGDPTTMREWVIPATVLVAALDSFGPPL